MGVPERTFAAVIPVVPKHIKYLGLLLSELESATKRFDEIWIIASSQNSGSISELNKFKEIQGSERIHLVTSPEKRTAGENRNMGFEKATSDYICFLDADDSYSPRRLEILDKVIASTGAELVYHDYFRLFPRFVFKLNKSIKVRNLATTEELATSTFSDEGIRKNLDTTKGGYTNLLLPYRLRRMHRIQHGHATVNNRISERFSSMSTGEDGEFARRCLMNNKKVVYVPRRLSIYDRATPRNLISSFARRVLFTLAKFKSSLNLGRN